MTRMPVAPAPATTFGAIGDSKVPAAADHAHPHIAGMDFLRSELLVAPTADITFSLLGLRRAVVVWRARSDTAAAGVQMLIQFNGDTGANYNSSISGDGQGAVDAVAVAQTSGIIGDCAAATSGATLAGAGEFLIPETQGPFRIYASGHYISEDAANVRIRIRGISYYVPPANSMRLFLSAGNFVAGSSFSLYGQ